MDNPETPEEYRTRVRDELRAFAEEYAGTEWDYDPEWAEVGLDSLRRLYAKEEAEERGNADASATLPL